jgi:hypothetical protein
VDHETDPGHDQHHDHAELVQLERGIHREGPGAHPGPIMPDDGLVELHSQHSGEVHQGDGEGQPQNPRPDPRRE